MHCRYYSATDPNITLYVANGSGATLSAIEITINTSDQLPCIAYNREAECFAIVWERRSAPGVLDGEVWCSSYSTELQTVQPRVAIDLDTAYSPVVAGDNFAGFDQAVIAWAGPEYVLAWVEDVPGPTTASGEVYTRTLLADGSAGCEPIELAATLSASVTDDLELAATQESGDRTTRAGALAVSDADGDPLFRLWNEAEALPPTNIGGGPAMDFELLGDPQIGSTDLVADPRIYDPAPTFAILNIAAGGVELPCSGCVWLPLRTTVLVALEPSAGATRIGSAPLTVPFNPALEGAFVDLQFTVPPTTLSPCAISPNLGISNRLRLTFSY